MLPILLLLIVVLSWGPASADDIHVIDGDTIVYRGDTVRLIGCDTPELHRSQCPDVEVPLGQRAADRLRQLLSEGSRKELSFKKNWRGVDKRDRWCRKLAWLAIDGVDVCCVLIKEGLAAPYDGKKRPDWCRRVVPPAGGWQCR